MSETATSSAIPERLLRYANSAEQIDYGLVAESARLEGQLQQFEGRCSEPQFSVDASHLGNNLRRYGEQCGPVDQWVRKIGHKFRNADLLVGWSASNFIPNRKSALPTSLVAWAIISGISPLIPGAPVWLLSLAHGVSWLNRAQWSGYSSDSMSGSAPVPSDSQGGFNKILENDPISASPTGQTGGLSASGTSVRQSGAVRTHLQQGNPVGRDERDEQLLDEAIKYRLTDKTEIKGTVRGHIEIYGCLMTAYTMLFQDRGLNVTVIDLYRQKYRSLNNNREPEEDVAKNGEAKLSNLGIGNIPNELAVREGYQYRDNTDHSLLGSTTAERIADLQKYIRDHDGSIVVNVAFRGSDPDWGHWIVVDSYNADGSFTVRDPWEPEGMNNVRIGEKLGDGIKYILFKYDGKYKIRYIERVGESL